MASCGKCGYQVRGISTLNCPECGADLREVGIVKPRSSKAGFWIVMILVVVLGMLGLCFVSGLLFWVTEDSPSQFNAPISQQAQPMPLPSPGTTPKPVSPSIEESGASPVNSSGATESPGQK